MHWYMLGDSSSPRGRGPLLWHLGMILLGSLAVPCGQYSFSWVLTLPGAFERVFGLGSLPPPFADIVNRLSAGTDQTTRFSIIARPRRSPSVSLGVFGT